MRILRYLFVTAIVLFASFLILLQTRMAKDWVRDQLVVYLEKETGFDVEIGDIKLFPALQMTAYDVKVGDQVEVDVFHFGLFPLALWEGYLHFQTLILDGVRVKGSKGPGGPLDIPIRIDIDLLKITNLKLEQFDNPIALQGSVNYNPKTHATSINLRVHREDAPKEDLFVRFKFKEGKGIFNTHYTKVAAAEGQFSLKNDGTIHIESIQGTGGPVALLGSLKVTPNLEFRDAHFTITSEEHPIFGEATLGGTLLLPELNLKLNSERLELNETLITDLSINIDSKKMEKGIGGQLSLKFTKDGQPYVFSGETKWDTPFSPQMITTLQLPETLQLLGIDTSNIEGKVAVEIDLSRIGPLAKFEIIDASYESYELGCIFKKINANVSISDGKATITNMTGTCQKEGTFTGSGALELDPKKNFPFDIHVDMKNTRLISVDNFKVTTTGDLNLTGNTNEATLHGTLEADALSFKLPDKSKAIRETLEITYINQSEDEPFPTPYMRKKLKWPLNLNIKVIARKEATIRGRGLTSDWSGEAVITGSPNSILVNGELKLQKGQYLFRGKAFDLKEGTITFNGGLEKETSLYVIASIAIEKGTAEVIVKGTVRNPGISFRSNPPMTQREILSWLIFNRGLSEISEFQGTQLSETITDLMKQVDTGPDVLTRLQSSLGIDRIEFGDSSGDGEGLSVQVSKHIGKDTYLTVSRRKVKREDAERTTEANSVGIETSLFKNVKLQAEVDDGQQGQVNLLWKRDY